MKIIFLFLILLKLLSACQIGNELCNCNLIDVSTIQMDCLLIFEEANILDFSGLDYSNSGESVRLTIRNKPFSSIVSSNNC